MAGLKPLLKDIADAIREKSGSTAAIPASEFTTRIGDMKTFDSAKSASGGRIAVGRASAVVDVDKITVSGNSLVLSVTVFMSTGNGASGILLGQTITVTFGS